MICCLNPDCPNPLNADGANFCLTCGTGLVSLLRNRYRIIQPIGRGGFARTYLAEDVDKLNEPCVVKQLVRGQFYSGGGSEAQKKATELFEREAKRLQELGKYDQIPTLYAYFKENDYLYLVQELIVGQNLLQELKQQGAFNETKIRQLLNDLLPVLELIHQQQVIHRDIKPENVIRRQSDGKLVLIDFGVSKQKTDLINTSPGTIIGSLGYAPMEQIQLGQAYPASDLYSLGIACFHLLADFPPSQLWLKQGFSWTNSWRNQINQPISDGLEHILDKLLQETPEQRYQSAREVLQDLNNQTAAPWNVPHTILSPQPFSTPQPQPQPFSTPQPQPQPQPQSKQHTYLSQLSVSQLLPGIVITSIGGAVLAIILLSYLGSSIMSWGLWLLILGGVILIQSRSLFEKIYLLAIAIVTNFFIFSVFHSLNLKNLWQSGTNGLIVVFLLIVLAGLLAFMLMVTSLLVDKLIAKYF
ncbi:MULTISPECIES: serine/threonine-protein kinase [Calothrix]|uniref:non-specific serine/threonine protein kinase n=2 Tax=Calothrix TaxID=1186 RepID=A0ABR8A646_9CYAN|nr:MULTISPECIES: serine/threonine-protein kinase [Calothrix]MBD2195406.1 serine/threonine protein kinase [Calothrix parietina FACHB-288]MBD2224005.1 serine/threonine protein kinase [Calothrix anomala FACHB-343]